MPKPSVQTEPIFTRCWRERGCEVPELGNAHIQVGDRHVTYDHCEHNKDYRLGRAREIYTKMVRSPMAYGVGVWHQPGGKEPKGIANGTTVTQSKYLRVGAGAYRAIQLRYLEAETFVPPILDRRVAESE